MIDPIDLNEGDPCPNCGGDFVKARALSKTEYDRIFNRDTPEPPPTGADTARPEFVAQHGALYLCGRCGYRTRFKDASTAADAGDESPDALKQRIAELEAQLHAQGGSRGASAGQSPGPAPAAGTHAPTASTS